MDFGVEGGWTNFEIIYFSSLFRFEYLILFLLRGLNAIVEESSSLFNRANVDLGILRAFLIETYSFGYFSKISFSSNNCSTEYLFLFLCGKYFMLFSEVIRLSCGLLSLLWALSSGSLASSINWSAKFVWMLDWQICCIRFVAKFLVIAFRSVTVMFFVVFLTKSWSTIVSVSI